MTTTTTNNTPQLTISTFITGNIDNNESISKEPETCPICLDNVEDKGFISLKCGHIIHNDCFYAYLFSNAGYSNRKRCPLCRMDILSREHGELMANITRRMDNEREEIQRREERREQTRIIYERREITRREHERIYNLPENVERRRVRQEELIERRRVRRAELIEQRRVQLEQVTQRLDPYPNFRDNVSINNQFRQIEGRWIPRRGTCGYKILQILSNRKTEQVSYHSINILLDYTHATMRQNIMKLQTNDFITHTYNGNVLSTIKWNESNPYMDSDSDSDSDDSSYE